MKRFYKLVSVSKADTGYSIDLDGKNVKTPLGTHLRAPTKALATLMQAEWSAQKDLIVPDSMPITQIITTALDRVTRDREEIKIQLLAYLDTDMICYRTEHPELYAQRQSDAWDPWLDWFEKKTGERLKTTTALLALTQSEINNRYVSKYSDDLDLWHFTLFQLLVSTTGSVVLSLAFMDRELDTDTLFTLSHVEDLLKSEIYNEDFYGIDPIQDKKWATTQQDFQAISQILENL